MRKASIRDSLKNQTPSSFETLETRTLLAATVSAASAALLRKAWNVNSIPVHVPTTENIRNAKNGPMANAGTTLIGLYRDYRAFRKAGGKDADFESDASRMIWQKANLVGVSVRGREGINALTTRLRQSGGVILARSSTYGVIEAIVPIGQLHELASDQQVATITPLYRGFSRAQQGSANNQAGPGLNADLASQTYGLDGKGVMVGVISDSADRAGTRLAGSIATGDLPEKGVLDIGEPPTYFGGGADEGRAMMELIHDIAPSADLAFSWAGGSQLAASEAVRALRAAGSDVIVDDIGYPTEPFFQPGVWDMAISDVVADGAVYLTAAGNDYNAGYEAPTNFTKVGRTHFVDFDAGPNQMTRMRVTFPDPGGAVSPGSIPFTLEWDNPFNGVVGKATTDLDIYFYDTNYPNRLLYAFTDANIKTGLPVETGQIGIGAYDIMIRVADQVPGTALPTRFKFISPFGSIRISTDFPENERSVFGHEMNPDAISVGAVSFQNAPPVSEDGAIITSEEFSSNGPATMIFDRFGKRLPTPQTLLKPDVAGIDDVNTSFFSGGSSDADAFPNFSGTSAAAPNVAAVVALIRQLAPHATPEQIRSSLITTARAVNDTLEGEWDPQGGFGLVDAYAAIQQYVTNPTVQISAVKPNPTISPIDSIRIQFNQQVTGLDIGDVVLSLDGGPNLLTGGNPLETTDGGRTYLLRNLRGITADPGTYTLELFSANSGIVNAADLPLQHGDTTSWTVLPPPPIPDTPSDLVARVISQNEVRVTWKDNSDAEDGFVLVRAEDSRFTRNVKTIRLGKDVTTYTERLSEPNGVHYYYRIKAFNNYSGASGYSNVADVQTLAAGEVILDPTTGGGVRRIGAWERLGDASDVLGNNYIDDGNTGKGTKSVRYTPNITATGEYYVYARWIRSSSNATNVPIDIYQGDGGGDYSRDTVTVNQRNSGGDGWVLLGKFSFVRGTGNFVQVRTTGTNGLVVAGGIRFLPASRQ